MTSQASNIWPSGIAAITLFVEELDKTKAFYQRMLELPVVYQDDVSAVFKFGSTLINLLLTSQADELINPAKFAGQDAGNRCVYTLEVEDVDAKCAEWQGRGIRLLNGPMNRPWGIRTASVQDPAGHIWELAGKMDAHQ